MIIRKYIEENEIKSIKYDYIEFEKFYNCEWSSMLESCINTAISQVEKNGIDFDYVRHSNFKVASFIFMKLKLFDDNLMPDKFIVDKKKYKKLKSFKKENNE